MKFKLLVSLVLCMLLVGCNSAKQVDPNVYAATGCPSFTMADDFQYAGSPKVVGSFYCVSGHCRPYEFGRIARTMADMYVAASPANAPQEVCLYLRDKLVKRHSYWTPVDGTKVNVQGREYAELFWVLENTEETAHTPC